MAVTDTLKNKYTVLYPSGDTINWLGLNGEVEISAVPGKQAYKIRVRVRIDTDYSLWFSPIGKLSISCNGVTMKTIYDDAAMKITNTSGSHAYGQWTDWYDFEWAVSSAQSSIKIVACVDLNHIRGETTKELGGPDYNSRPGQHFNKLYAYNTINVSGIVLGRKPSITSLDNNNKYTINGTTKDGVSNDTTSLSIKINGDFGEPTATINWKYGNASGTTYSNPFTLSGLTAGTSYTVNVQLTNNIGSSSWVPITIRTRHDDPVVSLSLDSRDLETLTFEWGSDKPLASSEYKIDSGSWINLGGTGTSGTFVAKWFDPNTEHTIYFRGISTVDYDSRNSNTVSASGITYDMGRIIDISDCIFGENISLDITNPSSRDLELLIETIGNEDASFVFTDATEGTYIFNPTQVQLDEMYKCYSNANTIPIKFKLTTIGENSNWSDSIHEEILTLTGIAKTAHIGISNKPRRCQVWIGDENNSPRRVVMWAGVDNTPKRTI